MLISTQSKLHDFCAELRAAGAFAFDTEFVQERSYYLKLGVVQAATSELQAVIDPQTSGSLTELFDLILDPSVEKIVHAGRIDLEIVHDQTGHAPRNIFDSQIAGAFLGFGHQISYANLVKRVCGVTLHKHQQLTDWTRRPLTKDQLIYAEEDVRHLPAVREELGRRLRDLDRDSWLEEECRYLQDARTYRRVPPEEIYLGMSFTGLNRRGIAILRELAAWREREAMERDVPRNSIMRDPVLLELTRLAPRTLDVLRNMRTLGRNLAPDRARGIIDAVQRGMQAPTPELPARSNHAAPPDQAEAASRLLEAWMRARGEESQIASTLLGTRAQLDALVNAHAQGFEPDIPLLQGWRRDLVGQDLLDILAGSASIAIDSQKGTLKLHRGLPAPPTSKLSKSA